AVPLLPWLSDHAPWHFLYFLPEPHGQRSFRPTLGTFASMLGLAINGCPTAIFSMSRVWFSSSLRRKSETANAVSSWISRRGGLNQVFCVHPGLHGELCGGFPQQ